MRNIVARLMVSLIPLASLSAMADTASEAKLAQELREIRQELNALKSKTGGGTPQQAPAKAGLRTENLGGRQVSAQTLTPSASTGGAAGGLGAGLDGQIPPELLRQVQESLGKLKQGQAEQTQFIQELDKEIK